jgi:monoamine oxidase
MANLLRADVVVVGAGFSGIQAATDVHRAGLTCLVVEAQDRIGGKSFTKQLSSGRGHVELGCTWINGTTQERMSALVKKYSLETRAQYLDGEEITQDFEGNLHMSKHGDIPQVSDPLSRT